jgi:hypothetical protein
VKSPPGPQMPLGNTAAARVRMIVWCKECQHRVEPDPAEMAARYGVGSPQRVVGAWTLAIKTCSSSASGLLIIQSTIQPSDGSGGIVVLDHGEGWRDQKPEAWVSCVGKDAVYEDRRFVWMRRQKCAGRGERELYIGHYNLWGTVERASTPLSF